MLKLVKIRLKPLGHAPFRSFFLAQCLSLIGTWSHELARSWLVLEIAGTTAALGTLLLSTALPGIFFTLHGGALADRADARKVLLITKLIMTISAFGIFLVTELSDIKMWMILAFGLVEGFVNSFDGPAFTSVFARTLPKEDFRQGLALQSTSFHVSRMLGPAVAGVLMATFKTVSAVFLFDALSYLIVIYIITQVKLRDRVGDALLPVGKSVKKIFLSMKYFFDSPTKRYRQFQMLMSVALIVPMLNMVFRSYLKQKFNLSAEEFGYLFAFPAMGAMAGAVYLTMAALKNPMRNLFFGVPLLVVSLLLLEHADQSGEAATLLGFAGFFAYLNVASITQTIQVETADHYRGRLGSLFTLAFSSIGPLMSFPIGFYADFIGFEASIQHLTLIFAAGSLWLAYLHRPWYDKPRHE